MQKITALILIGLLLAGCASAVQYPPVDHKTPIPRGSYATQPVEEPTAAATPIISELPTAASTAQAELAQLLGVDSTTVSVLAVETRQWPDACLGLANQAEVCAQQITEGYQIVMQAVGAIFTMRTNQDGSQVRIAYPSVGIPGGGASGTGGVGRSIGAKRSVSGRPGASDAGGMAERVPWRSFTDIACAEVITLVSVSYWKRKASSTNFMPTRTGRRSCKWRRLDLKGSTTNRSSLRLFSMNSRGATVFLLYLPCAAALH